MAVRAVRRMNAAAEPNYLDAILKGPSSHHGERVSAAQRPVCVECVCKYIIYIKCTFVLRGSRFWRETTRNKTPRKLLNKPNHQNNIPYNYGIIKINPLQFQGVPVCVCFSFSCCSCSDSVFLETNRLSISRAACPLFLSNRSCESERGKKSGIKKTLYIYACECVFCK